jgi:hypothetical protein
MVAAWIVIVLLTTLALTFIVRDLRHPSTAPNRITWARALPFAICAALSIAIAMRAPRGRRAFSVDFSVAAADLARSMTKVPHLVGVAVLTLLAVLAFGTRRLSWALAATMLLGVAWELCEATVVGHYARVSDLAPDLTGALVAVGIVAAMRWALNARRGDPGRL